MPGTMGAPTGLPDDEAPSFDRWLWDHRGVLLGVTFAIAVAVAVLYIAADTVAGLVEDKGTTVGGSIAQRLVIWSIWGLLALAMVRLGAGLRIRRRADLVRLPAWLVLGLAAGVCHSVIYLLVAAVTGWPIYEIPAGAALGSLIARRAMLSFAGNLVIFTMLALAYHAAGYAYDLRLRERAQLALEARVARSELGLLQMQLQPHFLFNALQTVSAVMAYDTALARRVLSRLGELLRVSIETVHATETTLEEELELLERYLDIQRTILADRLRVTCEVDPRTRTLLVPSFLLQPLVENAIRHAIEPRGGGGEIRIAAIQRGDRLLVTVADDGPGPAPAEAPNGTPEGVGLSNTRARLARLYGSEGGLDLRPVPGGGCEVAVDLPARVAGA